MTDRSHISKQQEEWLDEIFNADMRLVDVREYRKDIEEGHNLTPSQWMQEKALPEAERVTARTKRLEENQKQKQESDFQGFLNDKFKVSAAKDEKKGDDMSLYLSEKFPGKK